MRIGAWVTQPGLWKFVAELVHRSNMKDDVTAAPLRRKQHVIVNVVLALIAYFGLVVLLQHQTGALRAAFGAFPDEPSHYMAGLMLRDYMADHFPQSPVRYAMGYYTHLPFFALGYWPPLFYFAEGVWMLLFGTSRAAVLILIALIAATSATLIYAALRSAVGNIVAFSAGLLFLLSPIVQWSSTMVMTDLAVCAIGFSAALALARYLDYGEARDSFLFALLTALTILTKASGFFLFLLPLTVILSGRVRFLRRWSFWLIPIVIVVIAGPWFLFARRALYAGVEGLPQPVFLTSTAQFYQGFRQNLGWIPVLSLLGAFGLLRKRPLSGLAAVCIIQPVAVVFFLAMAPVGKDESRYLIPAFPPLIVLAAFGVHFAAQAVVRKPVRIRVLEPALMIVLVFAAAAVWLFRFEHPIPNKFSAIAEFVIRHRDPFYDSLLVSSDAEGPLIAEIAERDANRRTRFLVRPSKLLAHVNWMATRYESIYKTPGDVQAFLDRMPIDLVIIRRDPPAEAFLHERLLHDAIGDFPNRWRLVYSVPAPGCEYDVYEPSGPRAGPPNDLEEYLQEHLINSKFRFQ